MLKGIFSKRAFDVLSEVDKDNMIRNLRELQIITGLASVTLILMSALGGDDPDRDKVLNLAVNMITRTQADMMFYLNPSSTGQILNNLVAPINTFNDLYALGRAVVKTAQGDFVYESGPWKDQNRILVGIGRNLPITNGAVKMYNLASQVYGFN